MCLYLHDAKVFLKEMLNHHINVGYKCKHLNSTKIVSHDHINLLTSLNGMVDYLVICHPSIYLLYY